MKAGKQNIFFWSIMLSVILLFFLCACSPCKCIADTVEVERETIVHHRDTTVVTQADSASMVALLKCDSNYNVVLEELTASNGERLRLQGRLENKQDQSVLFFECHEDSLLQRIEWLEKHQTNTIKETVVRVEKEKGFFYYSGIVAWCVVGAILIIGLILIILKLK